MEIQVISEKQNPMLKRKEVSFQVEHGQVGSTPSRPEVRKAIATAIKADENVVFVRKFATRTGTHVASGMAHIYDTLEQAKLVEPKYIIKRNIPEVKAEKAEGPENVEKVKEAKEIKEAKETKEAKEPKEEEKE